VVKWDHAVSGPPRSIVLIGLRNTRNGADSLSVDTRTAAGRAAAERASKAEERYTARARPVLASLRSVASTSAERARSHPAAPSPRRYERRAGRGSVGDGVGDIVAGRATKPVGDTLDTPSADEADGERRVGSGLRKPVHAGAVDCRART
jgi:hypothetical protein